MYRAPLFGADGIHLIDRIDGDCVQSALVIAFPLDSQLEVGQDRMAVACHHEEMRTMPLAGLGLDGVDLFAGDLDLALVASYLCLFIILSSMLVSRACPARSLLRAAASPSGAGASCARWRRAQGS